VLLSGGGCAGCCTGAGCRAGAVPSGCGFALGITKAGRGGAAAPSAKAASLLAAPPPPLTATPSMPLSPPMRFGGADAVRLACLVARLLALRSDSGTSSSLPSSPGPAAGRRCKPRPADRWAAGGTATPCARAASSRSLSSLSPRISCASGSSAAAAAADPLAPPSAVRCRLAAHASQVRGGGMVRGNGKLPVHPNVACASNLSAPELVGLSAVRLPVAGFVLFPPRDLMRACTSGETSWTQLRRATA
jgi:hypothetical protein